MDEINKTAKHAKQPIDLKQALVWLLTVVISILFIFLGNRLVSAKLDVFNVEGAYTVKAKVTEILDTQSSSFEGTDGVEYVDTQTFFRARVVNGDFKGQEMVAVQTSDNYTNGVFDKPIELGDRVILFNYGMNTNGADWVFGGYARFAPVAWLGIVFFALLILFGRFKGLNTIISLSFTCLAVFWVFVPSVLAGWNVYLMTILTCVFTIAMTLLLTNGATEKSLTTILGCTFGVIVAAILEGIFSHIMHLTGMLDEHSIYLQYLQSGVVIDLKALIFAMVVIGAMGAVMDVAMDISSSLSEIHHHAPDLKFYDLVKSGINIGRDVMGTMANTLVLAYIGSSLCTILLLITYSSSLQELLNRESIAVEIMQALIGSMAILLTIPLTSIVCAVLYTRKKSSALVKTAAPKRNIKYKNKERQSLKADPELNMSENRDAFSEFYYDFNDNNNDRNKDQA